MTNMFTVGSFFFSGKLLTLSLASRKNLSYLRQSMAFHTKHKMHLPALGPRGKTFSTQQTIWAPVQLNTL